MNLKMSRDTSGIVTGGFGVPSETYNAKLAAAASASITVPETAKRVLINVTGGVVIIGGSAIVAPTASFVKNRQIALNGGFESALSDIGVTTTLHVLADSESIVDVCFYGG